MSYTYTTTETEQEHAERLGEDETQGEYQWCGECSKLVRVTAGCEHDPRFKTETVMITLVCSCGYRTCCRIVDFGLPDELFEEFIYPIPVQYERDILARRMKSEGN